MKIENRSIFGSLRLLDYICKHRHTDKQHTGDKHEHTSMTHTTVMTTQITYMNTDITIMKSGQADVRFTAKAELDIY